MAEIEEKVMTEAEVRAERLELLSENIQLKKDLADAIRGRDDRWEINERRIAAESERDQLRARVAELEGPDNLGRYDSYRVKVVQLREAKEQLAKLRSEYARALAEREAWRQSSIRSHDLAVTKQGEVARLEALMGLPGQIDEPAKEEKASADWTEEEYRAAFAEMEKLTVLDPDKESPEGRRLLELAFEVEDYEQLHFPISPPTKEEAEAFRKDQGGIKDLAHAVEYLNGRGLAAGLAEGQPLLLVTTKPTVEVAPDVRVHNRALVRIFPVDDSWTVDDGPGTTFHEKTLLDACARAETLLRQNAGLTHGVP